MHHDRPLLLRLAALGLLAAGALLSPACAIDLGGLSSGAGAAGAGGATSATTSTGATSTTTSPTSSATTTTSSSTSTTTGDGAAPVTPAALYALTQTCQKYPNSSDFASAPGGTANVPICTLKGAVWWDSALAIACDGGSGAVCKASTGYSSQTAGTSSTGQPLDASKLPFVVVPSPSNGFDFTKAGLGYGSVVAVLYKDQLVYAIIGDEGDTGVIGEGSYALAAALNIPNDPNTGGVASGVTYIAFTGPTAMVAKNEDPSAPGAMGPGLAEALIAAN
jgi:Fungal chitosanase of glycosyl hydrolase group 75